MPRSAVTRASLQGHRVVRGRAPLRLGLAGGGTDLSPYAETYGGVVVNATIDRYCHATVTERSDGRVILSSTDTGQRVVFEPGETLVSEELKLHAATYSRVLAQFAPQHTGVEIITSSDVPAGSGLGGSSTMVVAMLEALRELYALPLGEYELARLAWSIEREDAGLAGGRQDQYSATFGGFNTMEFGPGDHLLVSPMRLNAAVVRELEASLVLFYVGSSRESAGVISRQVQNLTGGSSTALAATHDLKREALAMRDALTLGNFDSVMATIEQGWQAKIRTSEGVTNPTIDMVHRTALAAGAVTGKVSGGGGGGFMWFMAEPHTRPTVVRALDELDLGFTDRCHFTNQGVVSWTLS